MNLEVASLTFKWMPSSCLYSEGQSVGALRMEAVPTIHRGHRNGMFRKLRCPVLEIRRGGWGGHRRGAYKVSKSRSFTSEVGGAHSTDAVLSKDRETHEDNITLSGGKAPCFVRAIDERKMRGLQKC